VVAVVAVGRFSANFFPAGQGGPFERLLHEAWALVAT